MWPRAGKKASAPEQRQTGIGPLTKVADEQWEGFCQFGGSESHVLADDVRGEPDPRLVALLSQQADEILDLARLAREVIASITEQHYFDLVMSPHEGGEVCLGFTKEEGDWAESVFVEFRSGKIVTFGKGD
jgi:hypothetical protein